MTLRTHITSFYTESVLYRKHGQAQARNIRKHYYFPDTVLPRNCCIAMKYGAESSQETWSGQILHIVFPDG